MLFPARIQPIQVNRQIDAWDRDYRTRSRLWSGAPRDLPLMPADTRVLELGCGNGKTLAAMASARWSVTALDAAPQAIRLCRQHTAPGERVAFVIGDARRLPFRRGSFDAVFATHIIGHVVRDERTQVAAECARVLCEGGRLFFAGFGKGDMRCGRGEEIEEGTFLRGTGIFTHYFDEAELRSLFAMLTTVSVATRTWRMRVRGRDLPRSEIAGVFVKEIP
jgi:SAM-dependent methyltransferase